MIIEISDFNAAGLALRRLEMQSSDDRAGGDVEESADIQPDIATGERAEQAATDPQRAPAYLAQATLPATGWAARCRSGSPP
jgi:hypothetical protein